MNHALRRLLPLLLALLLLLSFAACSDVPTGQTPGNDTTQADGTTQAPAAVRDPDAFCFTVGETTLWPGADPALLAALGEPLDLLEAASCVHEGMDRVYYYSGFEVNTQPTADGREVISSIYLTDDSVMTAEGVCIGMGLADVQAAYGDTTAMVGDTHSYTRGGVTLNFVIASGSISSIYYN